MPDQDAREASGLKAIRQTGTLLHTCHHYYYYRECAYEQQHLPLKMEKAKSTQQIRPLYMIFLVYCIYTASSRLYFSPISRCKLADALQSQHAKLICALKICNRHARLSSAELPHSYMQWEIFMLLSLSQNFENKSLVGCGHKLSNWSQTMRAWFQSLTDPKLFWSSKLIAKSETDQKCQYCNEALWS